MGHAVCVRATSVGDEPFAVILPDMLSRGCMTQMLAAYERHGGNIIAVEEVPEDETHKYGVVAVDAEYDDAAAGRTFRITGMVEKPPQGEAPSNLIISGRYILQPEIFDILSDQEKGAGNEIQLTDAMKRLSASQEFHAMAYEAIPMIPARNSVSCWPIWPMASMIRNSDHPCAHSCGSFSTVDSAGFRGAVAMAPRLSR